MDMAGARIWKATSWPCYSRSRDSNQITLECRSVALLLHRTSCVDYFTEAVVRDF
jgi:hypothetical protein